MQLANIGHRQLSAAFNAEVFFIGVEQAKLLDDLLQLLVDQRRGIVCRLGIVNAGEHLANLVIDDIILLLHVVLLLGKAGGAG